jgi:Glycosyl transferases group 1
MLELPIQYSGTVYVYCFDDNNPAKGIKTLYRQVDLLNKNGISAQIVHQKPGFRCTWFEHETSVTAWDQTNFTPDDTILLPEVLGANITRIMPGVPKVVFNQNGFLSFHNHVSPLVETRDSPYVHPDVIAALTVSETTANLLTYGFPKLPVFRMYYTIEPHVFRYTASKTRQICYLPRQHKEDADRLLNLLKYRGVLDDLALISLEGKTEAETAAILQESLIFLNLGYPEGFGLLPAEAMACGCIVIGYDGIGGREFLTPEYGYPIAYGDLVQFAQTIEQVLDLWESDRPMVTAIGKHAAKFIRETYSQAQEESSSLESWVNILRIRSGETLRDLANKPTQLGAIPEPEPEPFAPIDPDRKLFIQNLLMAPTACAEVRSSRPVISIKFPVCEPSPRRKMRF